MKNHLIERKLYENGQHMLVRVLKSIEEGHYDELRAYQDKGLVDDSDFQNEIIEYVESLGASVSFI